MNRELSLKLKLCVAATLAAGAMAPNSAWAKQDTDAAQSAQQVEALRAENARLRQQLADLQKERDLLKAANEQAPLHTAKAHEHAHMGHDAVQEGHDHETSHEAHGADHHMEPGEQMLFNPVFEGADMFHAHAEGMWMFSTKFMHMEMGGLRDGTTDVSANHVRLPDTAVSGSTSASPPPQPSAAQRAGTSGQSGANSTAASRYPYMMAPTKMPMDMYMLMAMYGVTDRLTLMGMTGIQTSRMDMLMTTDQGRIDMAPMNTSGLGDSELDAIYKIDGHWTGTLGLSIPTGSINQIIEMHGTPYRAPYDMQNGSGTVDLKPALTYNWLSEDALWNLGGQISGVYHMGKNSRGYSRGDIIKGSTWVQRAFGPATSWLRLAFTDTAGIQGHDRGIDQMLDPRTGALTPDADPRNYGGQRLDALIGASYVKGPFSFGVEGGAPFYQNLNGLQMKTQWLFNAGFQAMY